MLEFQEGFFEQEVRDGFYLDVTIKTLWASEMELLNKIAEVCAKYDLKWYAAYGTLLGAIRHEGFVPWDDDMDIWMMRKDYNKLMKVLQDELPDDYHVRSPLTETGYDQFHTCVNNGSGVSIAKSWLEANHNCPFTVGIDIFPLDYLPRNEKDRELQKSIFILVGRVAQVAKNIHRGDFDSEDATMTKEEAIAQVKEGLRYLKKNYKFTLDMKWIENEEWDKVASEVWKWGNYVASMYNEEESDYVAEYLDWARSEWKMFPKEWFAEQYSATFENFMVPIPCEYHKVLRVIYEDYMYFAPREGCHEYPFYARQLRQLKEYVKSIEGKAENFGLVSIDDIVFNKEQDVTKIWNYQLYTNNGNNRAVVLMANNPIEYLYYGRNAIDRLETIIDTFKNMQDKVILWWRPHSMMKKYLEQKDAELAVEYEGIIQRFKSERWGIYDESEDVECAVAACDAYYGEMNSIVQNVQNYPKPVMLTGNNIECAEESNKLRSRETRAFLSAADMVKVDGHLYFANTNYNSLVVLDSETKKIEKNIIFDDSSLNVKNMHERCVAKKNKILFLPMGNTTVRIYDIVSEKINNVVLEEKGCVPAVTWEYFENDEKIYLLPACVGQSMWLWNYENDSFEKLTWWKIDGDAEVLVHGRIDDNTFFSLIKDTNRVYLTNIRNKSITMYKLPDSNISNLAYDGENFWYYVSTKIEVIRWNKALNKKRVYRINEVDNIRPESAWISVNYCNKKVIVLSQNGDSAYVYIPNEDRFELLYEYDNLESTFHWRDKIANFDISEGHINAYIRNMGVYWTINDSKATLLPILNLDEEDLEYRRMQYRVMIERNALLFEDKFMDVKQFVELVALRKR